MTARTLGKAKLLTSALVASVIPLAVLTLLRVHLERPSGPTGLQISGQHCRDGCRPTQPPHQGHVRIIDFPGKWLLTALAEIRRTPSRLRSVAPPMTIPMGGAGSDQLYLTVRLALNVLANRNQRWLRRQSALATFNPPRRATKPPLKGNLSHNRERKTARVSFLLGRTLRKCEQTARAMTVGPLRT